MDDSFLIGSRITIPVNPAIAAAAQGHADVMYRRLVESIVDFENELSPNEEVGARLASFGRTVTIAIDDLGYHNPYLLKIYGHTEDGHRCTLLQHVSQVNVLLVALPAATQPAKRIGFELEKSVSADK